MTFSVDSNANTSNPPAGFKSSINYLATQIQRLIGGANWYSAPGFSLSQLSNNWIVLSSSCSLTPNTNILLGGNNLQLTFPPALNVGDSITLIPPANQVIVCSLNFGSYNFNSYNVDGTLGYLTITEPYTFVYAGEGLGIVSLLTQPQVVFNTIGLPSPLSETATKLVGTIFSSTPLDQNHLEVNAFDNSITSSFVSSGIPAYLGMDFSPHSAQLQYFRFSPSYLDQYSSSFYGNTLTGSQLQGWDGNQWTSMYTLENNDIPGLGGLVQQINTNSSISYSKYQFTNDDAMAFSNLEFWGNYTS